jgi:hypothetical protein
MYAVIDHPVQARLIAEPPAARSVTAALRYDGDDPLAVRVLFPAEASLDGEEVAWAFARDLLEEGLREPAGEGDVQIWPGEPGRTVLGLFCEEGVAVLEFRSAELRAFLTSSYELVPHGSERLHLHLDDGLAALLREV